MDWGAWKAAVHGVTEGRTRLSDFTFIFHFHALEKEVATHSNVLAWRIPGMGKPGGLPSHRVGLDWSDLAIAIAFVTFVLSQERIWASACTVNRAVEHSEINWWLMTASAKDGSWLCPPRTPWNDELTRNIYVTHTHTPLHGLFAINIDGVTEGGNKGSFLSSLHFFGGKSPCANPLYSAKIIPHLIFPVEFLFGCCIASFAVVLRCNSLRCFDVELICNKWWSILLHLSGWCGFWSKTKLTGKESLCDSKHLGKHNDNLAVFRDPGLFLIQWYPSVHSRRISETNIWLLCACLGSGMEILMRPA